MKSIGIILFGFISAWAWNEIFLRFARRLGALSQGISHQRRWDSRRKPIIGGIAFFIVLLGIAAWRPMGIEISRAFIAGGAIAFLTGLADDAFVSLPYMKLLGQLTAAGACILLGGNLLSIPSMPLLSVFFTLFWYVAVMNALNMMDNMDGIAGSLSLVLLLNSFWLLPQSAHFYLYCGLIGALGAFLLRNWHPSHLYMGDNGSQFLGFTLAYWGTEVWHSPTLFSLSAWEKVLFLVAIFALLAGDTFWVILVRLWEGRSPFHGGTDHLTHCLARLHLPASAVAGIIAGSQGIASLLAFLDVKYQLESLLLIAVIAFMGISIGFIHFRPSLLALLEKKLYTFPHQIKELEEPMG
ncbi:MAG: MraY family glycosyltransferase [Bacteroidia bacterium]|nr:undecaprenyl/decaprenyl-phosphate alpha-N-acetylglucosaminyl 1-phosphate transferase [Bacteroidia bacterium]MDW8015183.1 MraY family glycosyltransferase [Bacteroidia bacterium]